MHDNLAVRFKNYEYQINRLWAINLPKPRLKPAKIKRQVQNIHPEIIRLSQGNSVTRNIRTGRRRLKTCFQLPIRLEEYGIILWTLTMDHGLRS